jgi:hypothetical protein
MIGTAIAAGISLASSLFAARQKQKAIKAEERRARADRAAYEREIYKDVNQDAAAQALLNYASEQGRQAFSRAEGMRAAGALDGEEVAKQKQAAADMVANTAGNIKSQQDQTRLAVTENMIKDSDQHGKTMQAYQNEKAANIAAAGGAASNMMAAADGYLDDKLGIGKKSADMTEAGKDLTKQVEKLGEGVDGGPAKIPDVTAAQAREGYRQAKESLQGTIDQVNKNTPISVKAKKKSFWGGLD